MNHLLLKSKRVLKGYTQKEVGTLLRITESTYSKKENNKLPFSVAEAYRLKSCLDLTNEDLIQIFFSDTETITQCTT